MNPAQNSDLIFPAAGCWEVKVWETCLTLVLLVVKVEGQE